MKKRLRWIGISLSAVMLLGVCAGCGGNKVGVVTEEDPNTVPETAYEINWYFMGDTLKDTASVEAAANEYLKDKINATLKINRLETGQYSKKMSTMIAAGEYFDICFTANWMLDYKANAVNSAWLPLDDYIDTYMPKTKALMDSDIWDNVRVNGKIYGVPAKKEFGEQRGWMYRKDIAEKYNIDMSQVKNFDDLKPVLEKIKANEPDMQYPIDWKSDCTPFQLIEFWPITPVIGMFYDGSYKDKIVNVVETPEFMEYCKTAFGLYNDGFVKKDVMNASDFTQRLKDGKTFVYLEFLKPGKEQEVAKNFSFELAQAPLTPVYQLNGVGDGSIMSVSQTSKNPARAMRFLELLNTDPYLNNLLNYGIEGKHYTKVGDNRIEVMPNASYTLQGSQWMTGNVFLNYLTPGEADDKMQQLEVFNKNAEKPYFYGFKFDPEPVQQQIAACSTVDSEFRSQATMGAVNPETVIPAYIEKQKAAGVDEIIAEAQRQYDEWKAQNGK